VLVAHGGVLDVLYRIATGQDMQAPRTWQLGNAAINRLLWTPQGFSLVGWADTQHLDTMPAMKPTPEADRRAARSLRPGGQPVHLPSTRPALVVDLDAMERNITRMADFARKHQVRWRPTPRCTRVPRWRGCRCRRGAVGVCVQKTAEAEAWPPAACATSHQQRSDCPHKLRAWRRWRTAGKPGGPPGDGRGQPGGHHAPGRGHGRGAHAHQAA
jgi:hypothetical protein